MAKGFPLQKILNRQFVSMIFPPRCLGCDRELGAFAVEADADADGAFYQWQQSHWCDDCWARLQGAPSFRCEKCDARMPRPSPFPGACSLCFRHGLRFDSTTAIGNYQGLLQELVVEMKGQYDEVLASQFGRLLGYELLARGVLPFDMALSVPTHWVRRLKRGFHAAEIICDGVCRLIGMKRTEGILHLVRRTRKQGTLSTKNRFANVRGAFEVSARSELRGKRILLVDDVMTSGATTSELASILKRAGAAEVHTAVVARGVRGR